jgi:hypothetical protein
MLTNIGVPEATRNIIIGDGINTLSTLVDLYKEDIDGFEAYLKGINKTCANVNPPVRISPLIIGRLIGILFVYTVSTGFLNLIPDPINITQRMAQDYGNNYRQFKALKSADNDDDNIKLPKLEGHKNWITFRDQFENKLSQTMGMKYLSLLYVIDPTERVTTSVRNARVEVASVDVSDLNIFTSYAVHFGSIFKRDNATVWSILKTSLSSTQPYNLIDTCDSTSDDRKAWKMLKNYYEGEDFVEATIYENLAKIRSLFYHGETPKFTFDKFVQTQMECYKRLRDVGYSNGRGVDDATMCTDLVSSMMPSADLEVVLSLACYKGIVSNDYERLIQFLKAEIDNRNRRNKMWSRGRGKHVNGKERTGLTKVVDGKEVRSTSYTAEEFRKLTKNQRDAVKELGNKVKEQRPTNIGNNNNNNNNINAVSSTTMEERMRNMERAIVAGVTNATMANESNDNTSTITDNQSTNANSTGNTSASGDLRQRRNNQNVRPSQGNNN